MALKSHFPTFPHICVEKKVGFMKDAAKGQEKIGTHSRE